MLREHLERVVLALPHALSACIMGKDGIPVDIVTKDEIPSPVVASTNLGRTIRRAPSRSMSMVERFGVEATQLFVEYGTLVEEFRSTAQMFAAGDLEEIAARTEDYVCLMRPLNPSLFIALVLLPEAPMGQGRFVLRVLAPQLQLELS